MKTFILAMVLHPNVYKKAQAEIDHVVGPERLPDFEDREQLPYLDCVLKEVFRYATSFCSQVERAPISSTSDRWNAPVPLGKCSAPRPCFSPVINADDAYVTGVPHSASFPDNYRGYDVPEGAMIIPNIWCDAFSPRRRTFRLVLTLWTSNQVDDSGP